MHEDWGEYDWLNGWVDANDWYLVGDFMGLGHQQLVLMNRGGSLGRVMIADLATGYPVQIRYWESWGQSMWLDGWQDDGDVHLAGDFLGLGYDQWLTINRGGSTAASASPTSGRQGPPPVPRELRRQPGVQRLARRGRCDPGRRLPAPWLRPALCAAIAATVQAAC